MTEDQADMFAGAVQDLADGPRISSYQELTEGLMRRLAEKGSTLEQLCDKRMMNRSRRTLEAKCREYGIQFPDYIPVSMRPEGWRKKNG